MIADSSGLFFMVISTGMGPGVVSSLTTTFTDPALLSFVDAIVDNVSQ